MENGKKQGQTDVKADKRLEKSEVERMKSQREKAVSDRKTINK